MSINADAVWELMNTDQPPYHRGCHEGTLTNEPVRKINLPDFAI